MQLIRSNRLETLADRLASEVIQRPLDSPLASETVLVPSQSVQRWLALHLAQANGIDCNTNYLLPATWVWNLASSSVERLPQQDPLTRECMAWRLFRLLPQYLLQADFRVQRDYLAQDPYDLLRWQLCWRIADGFDRYQYYRPQMIRDWSRGAGEGWQARLWCALLEDVGGATHRVAAIDTLLQQLATGEKPGAEPRAALALSEALPQRLSIFAVSALPPLLLQVVQAVARHTSVALYQLAPSLHWWADLSSAKERARLELHDPDMAEMMDSGHELLASWGKQGRQLPMQLYADIAPAMEEHDAYHRAWLPTLLGRLQRGIFDLHHVQGNGAEGDDSLLLHSCHSPLRECQVLHDALLARFAADPTLRAEDVLVMVPEIGRYAPYIEAVFRRDAARPFIPWNLSDTTIAESHPLIRSFFQLLGLPQSRFTRSEILSYLDVPEIAARFGIGAEQEVRIRQILDQLHVHWGVDGHHRQSLGLPQWEAHSWRQVWQRLMAGIAFGDSELWHDIAPLPLEESDVGIMADFWSLIESLDYWRQQLDVARSAMDWQQLLGQLLDGMFDQTVDEGGRLQLIRDAVGDLVDQAAAVELSPQLLRQWMEQQLGQCESGGRWFSGGVTFCAMRPMAVLPSRVIALLGMQDAAFPRREKTLEFDLMASKRAPGDPHHGEMDRYLMLETLLSARDALHISYIGRSMRDNSVCQPSVLVQELLDRLLQDEGEQVVAQLLHHHPMQPFSADNYRQTGASYDRYWRTIAYTMYSVKRLEIEDGVLPEWPDHAPAVVDQCGVDEVALERLIRFVKHPVKFFFTSRLGIYLQQEEAHSDDEPFALDGLASWQLRQRLVDGWLHGEAEVSADAVGAQVRAEGMLPAAAMGDWLLRAQERGVAPLCQKLDCYAQSSSQPFAVDLVCSLAGGEAVQIHGQIKSYYPGIGLLHCSPSNYSGKVLLPAWIEHLALCASEALPAGESTLLQCRDKAFSFAPLDAISAKAALVGYLAAYRLGQAYPLPIFPQASWKWASVKDEKKAKAAVLKAWHSDSFGGRASDCEDPYIALAIRGMEGVEPVDLPEFSLWAQRMFDQPLACAEPA
ncbi:MAG: exodeoxyribonuclease V subunit gamma [Mariprofundales bacterium]